MNGFKICSDGELLPQNLPCPPAYSGPYSYPYDNVPLPPADSSNDEGGLSISPGAVAGIIVLVGFIFVLVCLFALKFGTRFTGRNSASNGQQAGDMNNDNGGNRARAAGGDGGLEEKLVKLLPVSEYHHEESKPVRVNCRECAVCLSSFEEKEFIRVLPKCQHAFHLPCIDRWFESHASCPLCREKITLQTIELSATSGPDHPRQANELCADDGLESNENLNHVAVAIPDPPFADLSNQSDHRISIALPVADGADPNLIAHHQSKQESADHHMLSPPPTSGAMSLRKSFSTGSLMKLDLHHNNCANNNYFFTKSQSLRAINIRLPAR